MVRRHPITQPLSTLIFFGRTKTSYEKKAHTGIHSTVEKRAKRMPDTTVETTLPNT